MTYDELLATCEGIVKVKEVDFSKNDFLNNLKGLYKNSKIAIDSNIELAKEKTCVLAEELGHHYTSCGNILDNCELSSIKQEKRARNWGYEKLVGIVDILNAYNTGARNRCEMAEYINVTEDFLDASIQHYKEKYGTYYEIDNYLIILEPSLGIVKMF
ncbi:hypothetical protein [Clostridium sp. CF012]|uniref:hypothetical protein n=1 Tax=Clostridium sp. CF012 TaxID=2843319 RepID=UPI001C0E638E|nr:hypothetical protein [Clostridium sp. CF012]MBU3145764.1 hypothetical protein [Clostridium sp. CF012]